MCASEVWRRAVAPLLLLCAATAVAQQPTREQEQLRRLRQQVQQLQQAQSAQQEALQRASVEAVAAKTQFDAAQAELRRLRAGATQQAQGAEALQKELDTARQDSAGLQSQLAQSQAALEDSRRTLTQARGDGSDLQRKLGLRESQLVELADRHVLQAQGLQQCIVNNQALRNLGHELLQSYADKGVAEVLAHNEPFLQTGRVRLENLLLGYQDKLDQLALKAPAREAGRAP